MGGFVAAWSRDLARAMALGLYSTVLAVTMWLVSDGLCF